MAEWEWRTNPRTGALRYVRLPADDETARSVGAARIANLTTQNTRPTSVESFESMTKDQLVDVARAQGLDSSGTKAQIIARLRS